MFDDPKCRCTCITVVVMFVSIILALFGFSELTKYQIEESDYHIANEVNVPTTCFVERSQLRTRLSSSLNTCNYRIYLVRVTGLFGTADDTTWAYSNYFDDKCGGLMTIPVGSEVPCYIHPRTTLSVWMGPLSYRDVRIVVVPEPSVVSRDVGIALITLGVAPLAIFVLLHIVIFVHACVTLRDRQARQREREEAARAIFNAATDGADERGRRIRVLNRQLTRSERARLMAEHGTGTGEAARRRRRQRRTEPVEIRDANEGFLSRVIAGNSYTRSVMHALAGQEADADKEDDSATDNETTATLTPLAGPTDAGSTPFGSADDAAAGAAVVTPGVDCEDDALVCAICMEAYNDVAVLRTCGHLCCEACTVAMVQRCDDRCPICRTECPPNELGKIRLKSLRRQLRLISSGGAGHSNDAASPREQGKGTDASGSQSPSRRSRREQRMRESHSDTEVELAEVELHVPTAREQAGETEPF